MTKIDQNWPKLTKIDQNWPILTKNAHLFSLFDILLLLIRYLFCIPNISPVLIWPVWGKKYHNQCQNWIIGPNLVVTYSSRLMVTGWFHWLVQDSRWRKTIWTFKLLTVLFVIMPAHYLYVEICDLIQV